MTTIDPSAICEAALREKRSYNEEHHIWPSQNLVADRLLARRPELVRAYAELDAKLSRHPHALSEFLHVLLSTAALWNPERNAEAREDRDRLVEVNREIADKANELAGLLEERDELHNRSGFYSSTHYSVCRVIEAASEENGLFRMYVKKPLHALSRQFDLKYWPKISEWVRVLARDADQAELSATDPLTEAATSAARGSRADFFKALFVAINENRVREHGFIPDDLRLTDETLAALANCALDLGPDDGVGGDYVKRLRQRERELADGDL
jgi:hypothetical protein